MTEDNPPRWSFKPDIEISVPQTAQLHADNESSNFLLIDIRESNELETSSIDGALHIPMGDIASRINELDVDEDTTIAILCRSGKRSLKVALYMHKQGLAGTRSVAGGINWWSERIDPTIKQY